MSFLYQQVTISHDLLWPRHLASETGCCVTKEVGQGKHKASYSKEDWICFPEYISYHKTEIFCNIKYNCQI